ncbi:ThiF family adenylyltransferase [Dokdonia ponticola]|uniref:ThiF family adenylyltransferase n=1 Tax=Dokdonia ponticola TaxID=2041041 RepID=A0ABV9I1P7_9FLAO
MNRYSRHTQLPEIGHEGQERLTQAKVLVVGAGGLGCPALQYLTAAGIGSIGIVDFDTVSLSNLQRQVLYREKDLGKNKALIAKKHLEALNSSIEMTAFPVALTVQNSLDIIRQYDIVVDASDNFATRYLINDTCVKLDIPMVYGSLYKFEGQVAVFNHQNGPTYRCLFPTPPNEGEVPNCSEIGVLGVLPGQIGILQATEVLKIILNIGEVLSGKVLYLDVRTHHQQLLEITRNDEGIAHIKNTPLTEVAIQDCQFAPKVSLDDLETEEETLWIDVRNTDELPRIALSNLQCIPWEEVTTHTNELKHHKKIILFCQSGQRAQKATQALIHQGIIQCYSLQEGAEALHTWIKTSV